MAKKKRPAKKEPAPLKHPATGDLAVAFERVVEIAKEFPGVEVSRSYGTPAVKVKGKLIARLRTEAEGGLAIHCEFEERDLLTQSNPKSFYITQHYANYPMVLVDLSRVKWNRMPDLIEAAWRMVAPKKLIKEYESE